VKPVVIVGAGITGLSCAYSLKKPYVILEKENKPGGLCGSVTSNGFTFDRSGHFIHLRDKSVKALISKLLKNNLCEIKRRSWIYEFARYIPYPFQANLYYLPEEIKLECLRTFIKKKKLKNPRKGLHTFLEWSNATLGAGITRYFMKPYNEKLWTVGSKVLTSDWVAPFVPVPKLRDIREGAFNPKDKKYGYNASFVYPKTGGSQALIDAFANNVKNIRLNAETASIDLKNRTVKLRTGEEIEYDNIVSTQPLTELVGQLKGAPQEVKESAKLLSSNSVLCINIGAKDNVLVGNPYQNIHWMYFPEKKYPFYRIGIYSNIAESLAPGGESSFYVEISHRQGEKINTKALTKKVIDSLVELKLISGKSAVTTVNISPIPYAYVIYDKYRPSAVSLIHKFLRSNGIYSIGRYGAWKYSFIEESILDAQKTAGLINSITAV
jgi:protoporphyrinogen oxidase